MILCFLFINIEFSNSFFILLYCQSMGSHPPTSQNCQGLIQPILQASSFQVTESHQTQFCDQITSQNRRNTQIRKKSSKLVNKENFDDTKDQSQQPLQKNCGYSSLKEVQRKTMEEKKLPPLKRQRKYGGDILNSYNDALLHSQKTRSSISKIQSHLVIFEDVEDQEEDYQAHEKNLRGYLHHRSKKFKPQKQYA